MLPGPGRRRVYARANLAGGVRALRWVDLEEERIQDLVDAGLVTLTDPWGNEPPDQIPQEGCCGAR